MVEVKATGFGGAARICGRHSKPRALELAKNSQFSGSKSTDILPTSWLWLPVHTLPVEDAMVHWKAGVKDHPI